MYAFSGQQNKEPEQAVKQRPDGQDLYFRLNVFISLAAAARTQDDIPLLSAYLRDVTPSMGKHVSGDRREVWTFSWGNLAGNTANCATY